MDIEEIYLKIGQSIVDSIEEDWTKAELFIEFFGDGADFEGRYETAKLKNEWFDVDDEIYYLLKELDQVLGNSKWNRAKFYLEPDGEFEMKFAWDQELADEIERLS